MKHNNESCHRRRRVCFSTEADDVRYLTDVAPSSIMTNEERDSAWYAYDDMIRMRKEAKILGRQLRIDASRCHSSPPPLSDDDGAPSRENNLKRRLDETACERYPSNFPISAAIEDKTSEDCRGLELQIFQGRQFKKYIAARTIMEYQRRYKRTIAIAAENGDPNLRLLTEAASIKLGRVSVNCSQWARNVALVTGYSDFKDVYEKCEAPLLVQHSLKRKRKNIVTRLEGEFIMSRYNKKHIGDAKSIPGSFARPIFIK